MQNPITGVVPLPVGDQTFMLKFSTAALISVEDDLDITVLDLPSVLRRRPRLRLVRLMLWAALQEHHAESFAGEPGLIAAGDLITPAGGMAEVVERLGFAVSVAFPKPKVKDPADPQLAAPATPADGTGNASTVNGSS